MPKPHAPRSGRARRQKYGPAVVDTHLGQHRLVRAVWQEDLTFGLLQSYLGQRLPNETRSPIRRSG